MFPNVISKCQFVLGFCSTGLLNLNQVPAVYCHLSFLTGHRSLAKHNTTTVEKKEGKIKKLLNINPNVMI